MSSVWDGYNPIPNKQTMEDLQKVLEVLHFQEARAVKSCNWVRFYHLIFPYPSQNQDLKDRLVNSLANAGENLDDDWDDPDSSYGDDVMAWVEAYRKAAKRAMEDYDGYDL